MKKSTEEFFKIFKSGEGEKAIKGYLYGKYTKVYIYFLNTNDSNPKVLKRLFPGISQDVFDMCDMAAQDTLSTIMDMDTSTYHCKVVKLDHARKLVTVNKNISIIDPPESVIPYKIARSIILNNPEHITVIDCPCRSLMPKSCQPLDVCMAIGEPFAGMLLEAKRSNPRAITPNEAVDILEAEDRRGHVHTAWFKECMGARFYAICNCCKCCCGSMTGHKFGVPLYAHSGFIPEVNEDNCDLCGTCEERCQFEAISVPGNAKNAIVNLDQCMGCGVCENNCPSGAIVLKKDKSKGGPLDIDDLLKKP